MRFKERKAVGFQSGDMQDLKFLYRENRLLQKRRQTGANRNMYIRFIK